MEGIKELPDSSLKNRLVISSIAVTMLFFSISLIYLSRQLVGNSTLSLLPKAEEAGGGYTKPKNCDLCDKVIDPTSPTNGVEKCIKRIQELRQEKNSLMNLRPRFSYRITWNNFSWDDYRSARQQYSTQLNLWYAQYGDRYESISQELIRISRDCNNYCDFAAPKRILDNSDITAYHSMCIVPSSTPVPTQQAVTPIISTPTLPTINFNREICDIDKNGIHNMADMQKLNEYIFVNQCKFADINGDRAIDAGDVSGKTLCNSDQNSFSGCVYITNLHPSFITDCIFSSERTNVETSLKSIFGSNPHRPPDCNNDLKVDAGDISALNIIISTTGVSPTPTIAPTVSPTFNTQACNIDKSTEGITREDIDKITAYIFISNCKYADINGDRVIDAGDLSAKPLCASDLAGSLNCVFGANFTPPDITNCIFSTENPSLGQSLQSIFGSNPHVPPDCNNDGQVNAGDLSAASIISHSVATQ